MDRARMRFLCEIENRPGAGIAVHRCRHVSCSHPYRQKRKRSRTLLTNVCEPDKFPAMAKSETVGIRLETPERAALERAAQSDDRTISALGRKIIAEWLKANNWLK